MARKIVYKKSGLNSQPTTPNGYKFVGYEDEIFSEKDGDIITPIGGGSNVGVTTALFKSSYGGLEVLYNPFNIVPSLEVYEGYHEIDFTGVLINGVQIEVTNIFASVTNTETHTISYPNQSNKIRISGIEPGWLVKFDVVL